MRSANGNGAPLVSTLNLGRLIGPSHGTEGNREFFDCLVEFRSVSLQSGLFDVPSGVIV